MSTSIEDSIAQQRAAFDAVVHWVFCRGGLQRFPRVVFFLAKENGGAGWEDSYQNLLVERICTSQWMRRHGDSQLWTCTVDGSEWYRESDEWRMLAYKERLTELDASKVRSQSTPALGAPADGTIYWSNDFFRTVGFDQKGIPSIDLPGIVKHLTELADRGYLELAIPKQTKPASENIPWWRRLWN